MLHIRYSKKGLRYLKKLDPNLYDRCVTTFAEAIKDAWQKYPGLPPLGGIGQFAQIPNAFDGGKWDEAAGSTGWLPGPGVANFVFAAAQANELRIPAGRYGATAAEWRPFLPPVARTIADIARAAAKKHSLRYREMLVSARLHQELRDARERKNLMLVLADARSLQLQQYHDVKVFDRETWEGAALLIPWNDDPAAWDATAFPAVANLFPITSQQPPPAFLAPIKAENFDQLLDITLAELRGALTKVETEKKEKMDNAPAQIVGSGETSP